jgi:hypothetical protein
MTKSGKEKNSQEILTILQPYTKELLKELSLLFETSLKLNYLPLQEQTLTGITYLATVLEKDFAEYYPMVMPGLKQLLFTIDNKSTGTGDLTSLKANAITTISFLCSAVSENPGDFVKDYEDILIYLIIALNELKDEDELIPTILEVSIKNFNIIVCFTFS